MQAPIRTSAGAADAARSEAWGRSRCVCALAHRRASDYSTGMIGVRTFVLASTLVFAFGCDSATTRGVGGNGGTSNGGSGGNGGNGGNGGGADGGGGGTADAGTTPLTGTAAEARQFCNDVLGDASAQFARCYGGTAEYYRTWFFSAGSADGDPCAEIGAEVQAGKRSFDKSQVSACRSQVMNASCDGNGLDEADACDAALSGTVMAGGSCEFGECASGNYCEVPGDACTGSCFAAEQSVGAPCTNDQACAEGLTCDQSSDAAPTCQPLGGEGDSCGPLGCIDTLQCDRDTETCQARNPAGTRCDDGGFRFCAPSLVCAGPVGARACRQPKKVGESCTRGDGECVFGFCNTAGRCALSPVVGESCDSSGIERASCIAGYCDAVEGPGTCRARKPAGMTCDRVTECESFDCSNGTCAAPRCP